MPTLARISRRYLQMTAVCSERDMGVVGFCVSSGCRCCHGQVFQLVVVLQSPKLARDVVAFGEPIMGVWHILIRLATTQGHRQHEQQLVCRQADCPVLAAARVQPVAIVVDLCPECPRRIVRVPRQRHPNGRTAATLSMKTAYWVSVEHKFRSASRARASRSNSRYKCKVRLSAMICVDLSAAGPPMRICLLRNERTGVTSQRRSPSRLRILLVLLSGRESASGLLAVLPHLAQIGKSSGQHVAVQCQVDRVPLLLPEPASGLQGSLNVVLAHLGDNCPQPWGMRCQGLCGSLRGRGSGLVYATADRESDRAGINSRGTCFDDVYLIRRFVHVGHVLCSFLAETGRHSRYWPNVRPIGPLAVRPHARATIGSARSTTRGCRASLGLRDGPANDSLDHRQASAASLPSHHGSLFSAATRFRVFLRSRLWCCRCERVGIQ